MDVSNQNDVDNQVVYFRSNGIQLRKPTTIIHINVPPGMTEQDLKELLKELGYDESDFSTGTRV